MFPNYKKISVLVLLIIPAIYGSPARKQKKVSAGDVPGRSALDNFPLIDGHNDFPFVLQGEKKNQLKDINLYNLTEVLECPACKHTDINKLKAGKVGALFFVAYVRCTAQFKDAVDHTLEQIDVIKRFVSSYPNDFQFVTTANGILKAFKNKKIGSLIAVEGGHSIANRLSILRNYYELGARYMTLTHTCNTPWADASPVDLKAVNNVTEFGKKIIREMNRLGMMVDLSHVSYGTMVNALKISKAPVIFSHSNAHAVHPHHRNVRDDVLRLLKANNGIIMANFYTDFVGSGELTIADVAKHINYIVDMCGMDHVGIGADYSGVDSVPTGLENVSKYPDLFDYLRKSNPSKWTIENLEKLAGRNLVRVFTEVEKVRDALKNELPYEDWIPEEDLNKLPEETKHCRTLNV